MKLFSKTLLNLHFKNYRDFVKINVNHLKSFLYISWQTWINTLTIRQCQRETFSHDTVFLTTTLQQSLF